VRRRECQSIPIDLQAVFHLGRWAPTVLATINWLIRAPVAPLRANASGLDTADCLAGLAESFQDKANLVAQAGFGVFAVLNAVLDQNRM
jgi:hypothetical protein